MRRWVTTGDWRQRSGQVAGRESRTK